VRTVEITAHRGSSTKAPENTLSALRLAIEDQAEFAEVDVQRTQDGVLVLFHDGDLQRVAGRAHRLSQMTLDELREVDVGRWFSAAFRDERVPTLQQTIDLVRGRMRLNLELKYNLPDPALVPGVVELLRQERCLDHCLITSMDYGAVTEVKRLEPRLRTGLILTAPAEDLDALEVDVLSVPLDGITPELVRSAHGAGKQIHVWTVNQPEDMRRMIEWGVDNIITDKPDVLRSLLVGAK
jgi:glycerophosphoryl diester phosphodiesterase